MSGPAGTEALGLSAALSHSSAEGPRPEARTVQDASDWL